MWRAGGNGEAHRLLAGGGTPLERARVAAAPILLAPPSPSWLHAPPQPHRSLIVQFATHGSPYAPVRGLHSPRAHATGRALHTVHLPLEGWGRHVPPSTRSPTYSLVIPDMTIAMGWVTAVFIIPCINCVRPPCPPNTLAVSHATRSRASSTTVAKTRSAGSLACAVHVPSCVCSLVRSSLPQHGHLKRTCGRRTFFTVGRLRAERR